MNTSFTLPDRRMPWMTKSVMPVGGEIMPACASKMTRMPNQTGSKPRENTTGAMIGNSRNHHRQRFHERAEQQEQQDDERHRSIGPQAERLDGRHELAVEADGRRDEVEEIRGNHDSHRHAGDPHAVLRRQLEHGQRELPPYGRRGCKKRPARAPPLRSPSPSPHRSSRSPRERLPRRQQVDERADPRRPVGLALPAAPFRLPETGGDDRQHHQRGQDEAREETRQGKAAGSMFR